MNLKLMACESSIKVFTDALKNFAKEGINGQPISADKVQIWIGTKDPDASSFYMWLVKDGNPYLKERVNPEVEGGKEMSPEIIFVELMGVLNDLTGDEQKFSLFATRMFRRIAEELGTDPRNIEIQITTPADTDAIFPIPILYDRGIEEGEQYVRNMLWDGDVFTDADADDVLKQIMSQG